MGKFTGQNKGVKKHLHAHSNSSMCLFKLENTDSNIQSLTLSVYSNQVLMINQKSLENNTRLGNQITWSNKEGFFLASNSMFKSFKPLLKALLFWSLHLQRSPSSTYRKSCLARSNSSSTEECFTAISGLKSLSLK